MDKVIGGTPKGSGNKCDTCRFAVVMRGINLQTLVHCQYQQRRAPFRMESCSAYDDKRNPSLYDMQNIAWNIETRNRGQMGFTAGGGLVIEITPPKNRGNDNPAQPTPPAPA